MTLAALRLSSGTPTSARRSSIQMAWFPSSTVVKHTKKKERERKFPKESPSPKHLPAKTSQVNTDTHPFLDFLTNTHTQTRSAVLRYAQTIRILYLQRRYTTLRPKLPPQESRDRFKSLVVIQETFYDFKLTAAFTQAISNQEAALPRHQAQGQDATANPAAAGPS